MTIAKLACLLATVSGTSLRGGSNALSGTPSQRKHKNVLHIIMDDARPELNKAYGQTHMHTPRLDALAGESTVFTHAFAQIAVCGPSRNSIYSGRRPDHTQTYSFMTSFRDTARGEGRSWLSMPEFFKATRGYYTCGAGKTYHDDQTFSPPAYDAPRSWSPGCEYYTVQDRDLCPPHAPFCSKRDNATGALLPDAAYEDHKHVAHTLAALRNHTSSTTGGAPYAPFFWSLGIRRPHNPYAVPARFLGLYDEDAVAIATHQTIRLIPAGGEAEAISSSSSRSRSNGSRIPAVAWFNPLNEPISAGWPAATTMDSSTPLPAAVQRQTRKGYYAAMSWVDHLVGELLGGLGAMRDAGGGRVADDTLVVLHADHGYQLGEKGLWAKESNFDLAARVPLLVRVPWRKGSAGRVSGRIVELVDLYRTLAEVAYVQVQDEEEEEGEGEGAGAGVAVNMDVDASVDGRSFASELGGGADTDDTTTTTRMLSYPDKVDTGNTDANNTDADAHTDADADADADAIAAELAASIEAGGVAYSQYPRCLPSYYAARPDLHGGALDQCMLTTAGPDVMGYSVRTQRWRYTEWFPWSAARGRPVWIVTGAPRVGGLDLRADVPVVAGAGVPQARRELYRHAAGDGADFDALETVNLAYEEGMQGVVKALHMRLLGTFRVASDRCFEPPYCPYKMGEDSAAQDPEEEDGGSHV